MKPGIPNDNGQAMGMEGSEDIRGRTPIGEQIKTLTSVVEQTADHVMITDMKGIILYVNPAFEKTTGYTAAEILGRTPKILKSGEHGKDYYAQLWSTILAGKTFYAQTTNKNKKGQLYVADQTISPD